MFTHRQLLDNRYDGPIPAAEIAAANARDEAGVPLPSEFYIPTEHQEFANAVSENERLANGIAATAKKYARERRYWRIHLGWAVDDDERRWCRQRIAGAEREIENQLAFLKVYRARRAALQDAHPDFWEIAMWERAA